MRDTAEDLPIGKLRPIAQWVDPQKGNRSWPIGRRPLFEPQQSLRRLVAVISEEVFARQSERQVAYLFGLLQDDSIHLLRYADAGPPQRAERTRTPSSGGVEGWVVFKPDDRGGNLLGEAITVDDRSVTSTGIWGEDAIRLAVALGARLYETGPCDNPQGKARVDALAGIIAERVGADVLVTTRPLLTAQPFPLARGVACPTPEEALPIVGLYLRRQGRFIVHRTINGSDTYQINSGLFYWIAARDLLPSGWKWASACMAHSAAVDDDTLAWLAASLHERIVRVLRARDRLHSAMLVPQDDDTADEAIAELDVLLVTLMGSFDAAAHVADAVLGLSSKEHDIGWQKSNWRRRLAEARPSLCAIVAPESVGCDILTVLRLLRNSVHGEALPPLATAGPLGRDGTLVGLPRAERDRIRCALDRLGGAEAWGVRDVLPDRSHADLRMLVERLVPASIRLLDHILAETPVDLLSGTSPQSLSDGPSENGVFASPNRERIRWQLGL